MPHPVPPLVPILLTLLTAGCVEVIPSPFQSDAGPDADADTLPESGIESGADGSEPDADPSLGGPCLDDNQCDDEIDCTFDHCDLTLERCRHESNHLACQDDRYCNGPEVCDPKVGCIPGEPVTCSDLDSCTIDQCVESTQSCAHELRDADGDEDPDWLCGGGDCNDSDPLVNSLTQEICANSRDDDCDGEIDEQDCVYPTNDTCSNPLMLTPGVVAVASLVGTKPDYAGSCIPSGTSTLRDIVAAVSIPNDQPYDLDVLVRADSGSLYSAAATQCGDPATEVACQGGSAGPLGPVARFLARDVPSGMLPIYIASDQEQSVRVQASLRPAQPKPDNETCGTAASLVPGQSVVAEIVDVFKDIGSICPSTMGDLVYQFTTDAPHDVYVFGGSLDGLGNPVLSLRTADCAKPEDEIACKSAEAPVVFLRALPAGTYYVAVSATAPTSVQLRVELAAPSAPPEGDDCEDAPALVPNVTQDVTLDGHVDDLKESCLLNAIDAARTLTLDATSDVLLLGNLSSGDEGAVSLWRPACQTEDLLSCESTAPSPVRTSLHNLEPGDYRAVIETRFGNPTRLTAFTRPATAPTFVVFADTCDEAHPIPPLGGLFQGNTANASAKYAAGCDQAGGATLGAPEQLLRLELEQPSRVVFDMRGSGYRTLLNVRKGPGCPGTELVGACTIGFYPQRSFLDLQLDPGVYFVQVDGYFGETGPWYLDVFVVQ